MVVALALTLDARQSSEGQGRIVRMKNHFVPAARAPRGGTPDRPASSARWQLAAWHLAKALAEGNDSMSLSLSQLHLALHD